VDCTGANINSCKYLSLVFSLIVFSYSEKSNPIIADFNFTYFTTNWTNSFEEQTKNDPTQIFRPSSYKEF